MNRAERRRIEREARQGAAGSKRPYWILVVCVGAALIGVGIVAELSDPGHHPVVRAAEHQAHVVEPARYARMPRAEAAYQKAAAIPEVLDGLFCYCFCGEHSGHYSLLDCFSSDHGAACDVCMREVEIAYDMVQQGASLDQIRGTIDATYGA